MNRLLSNSLPLGLLLTIILLILEPQDSTVAASIGIIAAVLVNEEPITRNRRVWAYRRQSTWKEEHTWPEHYFIEKTRLSRKLFDELAAQMPYHKNTRFRDATPKSTRLAAGLRYLAKGTDFSSISDSFGIGETTARKALVETVLMIEKNVPFPTFDTDQVEAMVADFAASPNNFPGTAGAVDGTHIRVRTSEAEQAKYWCYKGFTSVLLLGVCKPNLEFTFVHCGAPGRAGDAAVFEECGLSRHLEQTLDTRFHLIGDSAFPLRQWIQRPYQFSAPMPDEQRHYNYTLSKTRMCIERAFGLLKNRFRCLYKQLDFEDVAFSVRVISACVRLHNLIQSDGDLRRVVDGHTGPARLSARRPETESEMRQRQRTELRVGEQKQETITRTLWLQSRT